MPGGAIQYLTGTQKRIQTRLGQVFEEFDRLEEFCLLARRKIADHHALMPSAMLRSSRRHTWLPFMSVGPTSRMQRPILRERYELLPSASYALCRIAVPGETHE